MYNNNPNSGYQQQQGGYGQERPGLANDYYSAGQQPHGGNQGQYNQSAPPYQQQGPPYGQQQQQYGQQQQQYGGYNSPPPPSHSPFNQPADRDQDFGGPPGYSAQPGLNNEQEGERGMMGALAGGATGAFGGYKLGGAATGHKKTSGIVGAIGGAIAGHYAQQGVSNWKDKRDEKKEREEEEKKQQEYAQQHQHGDHHHGGHHDRRGGDDGPREGNFAGGFSFTSRDVRLDAHGEFTLHAQCRREDGSYQSSSISLNRIIMNDNGSFRWASGNSSGGGSSSVTVQQGDTLRAIAARHNCSYEDLARRNGIQNADMIYPGQRLEVPGGGNSSGGGGGFGSTARNARLIHGGQTLEAELMMNGQWVTSLIVLDERITNKNGCLEFI